MTWATLAIVVMTRREIPSWRASIVAGLLIGLALGTRIGGVILLLYLLAALTLCGLELIVRREKLRMAALRQIALRFMAATAIASLTAYAIWPWLQIGNPLTQFKTAYLHFARLPMLIRFQSWGRELSADALPWHYIPEQLLARLPELFILLLAVAIVASMARIVGLIR